MWDLIHQYYNSANPIETRERMIQGEMIDKLNEESPRIEAPPGFERVFKPHQLAAIERMRKIETGPFEGIRAKIGVFCDRVGSGKTYAMLGFLKLFPHCLNTEDIPISYQQFVSYQERDLSDFIPVNLVIVPRTIVLQWEQELAKTSLRYRVISKRSQMIECIEMFREYDVIVTSNSFYTEIYQQCMGYRVERVIFDEADSIAVTKCERIQSRFYWFITSTIHNLVYPSGMHANSRNYIEGIRKNDFIRNTFLSVSSFPFLNQLFVQNDDRFVQESFKLPDPIFLQFRCKSPSFYNVIGQFTCSRVTECFDAGDIQSALQHLRDAGVSVQSGEHVVQSVANHFVSKVNNLQRTIDYVKTLEIPEEERTERLEQLQKEITSARARCQAFEEKLQTLEEESCPICYETLKTPTCMLWCCKNLFCYACTKQMTSNCTTSKCPFCRVDITMENLKVIGHAGTNPGEDRLTKLEQLRKVIRENPQGKFLVFSSYENTFHRISEAFADEPFSMERPMGNSHTVQKKIQEYRNGNVNILLLNSRHLGAGLNLECTTHVIFFHRMSNSLQQQVIGRAQRAGRTDALHVYHLLHMDE